MAQHRPRLRLDLTTGSADRLAVSATNHCLTGCAAGEVVGMAVSSALGWSNAGSIVLAIVLAFLFGYSLTSIPLARAGLALGTVVTTALAGDTVSITIMEAIDNLVVVVVPGALAAGLGDAVFWWSIALGFAVAYPFAFLAQRALIRRGKGHAHHGH
jgi:hypothetical protein